MSDPFVLMLENVGVDVFMSSLIRKKFEDGIFRSSTLNESDFLPVVVDGSGWVIGRHGMTGIGDFYSGTHGGTGTGWF
jgi:hypothetical protein